MPLMATSVGRFGSVPASSLLTSRKEVELVGLARTVAFGQLLDGDGVIFGRVELDGDFGLEALGLWFVVGHVVCYWQWQEE